MFITNVMGTFFGMSESGEASKKGAETATADHTLSLGLPAHSPARLHSRITVATYAPFIQTLQTDESQIDESCHRHLKDKFRKEGKKRSSLVLPVDCVVLAGFGGKGRGFCTRRGGGGAACGRAPQLHQLRDQAAAFAVPRALFHRVFPLSPCQLLPHI